MKARTPISEAIGTDAFLDIVANLVGILLILIMVIGVRMDDASHQTVDEEPTSAAAATAEPLPEVVIPDPQAARSEVQRIEQSILDADRERRQLEQLTRIKKADRDNLMLAVTHAKHVLDERRSTLNARQREQLDASLQLQAAQEEYQSIIDQLDAARKQISQPAREVLQHFATPLAKTVFVQEEHFRLQAGRLVYVPLIEMTNALKREAPRKLWKLENARQITETIGPQEGFELRYTLRRHRVPFRTDSGMTASREVVELDRFVMVPVGNLRGESVDEAMQTTSAFRRRLSGWSSRNTIITVWVYPDSFGAFRELKGRLHELGFLTAARPIPEDQLISGSPHGTRSAAQ